MSRTSLNEDVLKDRVLRDEMHRSSGSLEKNPQPVQSKNARLKGD
jgi:hypothetical protein